MSFREVIISSNVKMELKLNYLVCRGEKNVKIHIPEISTLIIESTAVSITAALLCELVKNNVKIIFCDEKHSPHSELLPYYGSYNGSKRIKMQILWKENVKKEIWASIVKRKIEEQAKVLSEQNRKEESVKLFEYANEVVKGDTTNREGHAAKLYFLTLFGESFSRGTFNKRNKYLNYGYAILLSAFNRAIAAHGYFTQLGIWHKNEYNDFNLSCDFMEPFRPVIDRIVLRFDETENTDYKLKLIDSLNVKTKIKGQVTTLENAIGIYVRSVIDALNTGDKELINFAEKYEL